MALDSAHAPEQVVEAFDGDIARASWFAAAGAPLTDAERDEARRYLDSLGLGPMEIGGVPGWSDARAISNDPDWDHGWWDAEETERKRLLTSAEEELDLTRLHKALSRITRTSDMVHGAAAIAGQRDGIADPALIKSAAGAATQACYLAGLALIAGAGSDHPFAVKFRLFAGGRWPLGVVRGTFYLL